MKKSYIKPEMKVYPFEMEVYLKKGSGHAGSGEGGGDIHAREREEENDSPIWGNDGRLW